MGDLIHTLPAVSDMAAHLPGVRVDWVAEQSFAEIPTWHPAVERVVPVALRRWRKAWWTRPVRTEWKAYLRLLRERRYDAVIDSQGLIKSAALVAARAHGPRHGLDWHSAREPLASVFYQHKHRVEPMQAAVTRYRKLAGLALGYAPSGPPQFSLQALQEPPTPLRLDDGRLWPGPEGVGEFAAIMPSASRDPKLWPVDDWRAVLRWLAGAGCPPVLFAGNAEERARAQALAEGIAGAWVMPRMPLADTARVVNAATVTVGLDSGITHLSAALGRPTVGIYCATPVVRTPMTGPGFCLSLGDRGRPPSRAEVLAGAEQALATARGQAAA
ncbi:lipopolysaccharide heptosyltransferase I [Verticiella sediminum]|uniref:Lipopolysaccharide heptosyltransferase 1 n=1 Tax=Verticiella sediminum TaxID=1247510 RepID=A0A556A8E0_9BURK|nr:lipopolysaccharide heptosyltransferase I [Verticiella sediminum]